LNTKLQKIDSHHHLWQPLRGDYDWMPQDNKILNHDYSPSDLAPALKAKGVDGTVLVQAAATVCETEYMLGLADATPFIMKEDIQWAFKAIIDLDLTFDALGFPVHLKNFHTLLTRYPEMQVVYDHCMKPQIRDQRAGKDAFSEWADGVSQLAEDTSGCCKLSGLVTEADSGWTIEDLRPFTDHILQAFGASRVMWGSDWPVCKLEALTENLTEDDRAEVFGNTASRFYRL